MAGERHGSAPLPIDTTVVRGDLGQVDDSVHSVPCATLIEPELGQQARLLPVVGTPNAAAEKDTAAVAFARA
jgi:hypothetical protein